MVEVFVVAPGEHYVGEAAVGCVDSEGGGVYWIGCVGVVGES